MIEVVRTVVRAAAVFSVMVGCGDDGDDAGTDTRADTEATAGDTAGETTTPSEDTTTEETTTSEDTSPADTTTPEVTDTSRPDGNDVPPDTTPPDDADVPPDTTPEDTELMDVGPDGIDPDSSSDTDDTSPGAVTWDDVQPIFATSCSPCHSGNSATAGSGGHAIASSNPDVGYAASQLDAGIAKCAGLKVGECALVRIRDGSMPATGDCREPVGPKCPDLDEQALIEQWIEDGMQR